MTTLPTISKGKRVCLDLETTSFNDAESAFYPWLGHSIAGVAVSLFDESAWYLPIWHHNGDGTLQAGVLPEEEVFAWLRDLCADETREIFGQNFKFDLKFLAYAGIDVRCRVADVAALCRLVDNDRWTYDLDGMAKDYGVGEKTRDEVQRWLDDAKTKDYGRLPIRLAAEYAINDVRVTYRLRSRLEALLPEESRRIWENERRFTRILSEAEVRGVPVFTRRLKEDRLAMLRKMLELNQQIDLIAGWETDPRSRKDRTELLVNQLGYEPQAFTKTNQPRWDRETMEHLIIPDSAGEKAKSVGLLYRDWTYLDHFERTYLDGWLKRTDDQGLVHCDWRQYGTRTGRLSASDPNLQSVPGSAERYVLVPEGDALIGYDYSQIEYRLFGHYTGDPVIVQAYRRDPFADFHGQTGEMVGVPRAYGKMLNFGIIYGMGKRKMIASIRYAIEASPLAAEAEEDETTREGILEAITKTVLAADDEGLVRSTRDRAGLHQIAESVRRGTATVSDAALGIYLVYHAKFPSIRRFTNRVMQVAGTRGWVRNLYGRRYNFESRDGLYKAVNYLIQGSAADMLRYKIVEADALARTFHARFAMTVHDSVYYYVPLDTAPEFYCALGDLLEHVPEVSLPIRVEGSVATTTMAAKVVPEARTADAVRAALVAARTQSDEEKSALRRVGAHIASARGL